jgi:copper transport protein
MHRGLSASPAWLAIVAGITIAVTPRAAFAHAHLVKSAPAANSHLSIAPTQLQLWFSEVAEATMTTVTVSTANGERVSIGPVSADSQNPLMLSTPFTAALAPGTYTVTWRTVAKDDGHPSNGTFSFVVDAGAAQTALPAASSGTAPVGLDSSGSAVGQSAGSVAASAMNVEAPSYVVARWLNFVALILVIGVVAFRFLVVPRVPGSFGSVAIPRAASLGAFASVAVLIASIWRLFAERAVIGGVGLGTVIHSYWGTVWQMELSAALLALVVFAIARRSESGSTGVWLLAAIAAIVLGAVSAFSGHAIAAPQYRNTSVALDVIHVLAAGSWLGGLCAVAVVGVPAALSVGSANDGAGQVPLIARVVNAFSPVALTCAGAVVITGVLAAKMHIGSFAALFGSSYGKTLLIKLAFVLLVVAGGAFNWLRMRNALSRQSGNAAINAFRRSAWFELSAGILVIAATAVLVATQPPVH